MTDLQCGKIIKINGGFYTLHTKRGNVVAKPRGIFRKDGFKPFVGDDVEYEIDKDAAIIRRVLPRKNFLIRPPVANLDQIFFVVSSCEPNYNLFVLDQLIIAAESQGIEPILVFTKLDIQSAEEVVFLYKEIGFTVLPVLYDQIETEIFLELFAGKVSVLCGNSGVGKTTLMNRMDLDLVLKTSSISEKLGRGRHTTRLVELYPVGGGWVADTPGFSTVDLKKYGVVDPACLPSLFRELRPLLAHCRFRDCTHMHEPGCAVLEALQSGQISQSRYQSYQTLRKQLTQSFISYQ